MPDDAPKSGSIKPPPDEETDDGPRGSGPKIRAPKKDSKPAGSGRPQGRPETLEKQMQQFFYTIGIAVSPLNGFDGMAIMQAAEVNAKAHASLARKNARVKQVWERILAAGAVGEVATASCAILVPVLMNHGAIPPNIPMPKEWPSPPIQLQWREEMARRKAQGNGGPST